MTYKLRLVEMSDGKYRIQKRHWFLTLGFWVTLTTMYGTEYWETSSKSYAEEFIVNYYKTKNRKVVSIKEY